MLSSPARIMISGRLVKKIRSGAGTAAEPGVSSASNASTNSISASA
jgi:hypothetical protein